MKCEYHPNCVLGSDGMGNFVCPLCQREEIEQLHEVNKTIFNKAQQDALRQRDEWISLEQVARYRANKAETRADWLAEVVERLKNWEDENYSRIPDIEHHRFLNILAAAPEPAPDEIQTDTDDPFARLTPEQSSNVKPLTEEEINSALKQGKREADSMLTRGHKGYYTATTKGK